MCVCVCVCECVCVCVCARAREHKYKMFYDTIPSCAVLCYAMSSVSCYVFTVTGQLRLISPMKSSSGNMTPQWSSPKLQLFKEACIDIHCYCSLSRLALPILWTAPLTGMDQVNEV